MKAIMIFLGGLGIMGAIAAIGLAIMMVVTTVIGIWLAFSASIVLGIICLFPICAPANFVFGLCWWFGTNVPEAIQAWANFPI